MSMRPDRLGGMRACLIAFLVGCNYFGSDATVSPDAAIDAGRPVSPVTRAECETRAREMAGYGAVCATVYMFDAPADNPLGHVEGCVPEIYLDEAQAKYGAARPSNDPRFAGDAEPPCIWTCPEVVDCNAYDSCLCPGPAAP
jgi:hypothetical protein